MPGKYTVAAKKLERVEPDDQKYQEKVEEQKSKPIGDIERLLVDSFKPAAILKKLFAHKTTLKKMSDEELGRLYATHKGLKVMLENDVIYKNNMILAAIDQEWTSRLDQQKKDEVRITDLGLFSRQDQVVIKIVDDDLFDAWCFACRTCGKSELDCDEIGHHYEPRADYRVRNTNKVAGDVREMLINGDDAPPGIEAKWRASIKFTAKRRSDDC
jgi:hypothetical protein